MTMWGHGFSGSQHVLNRARAVWQHRVASVSKVAPPFGKRAIAIASKGWRTKVPGGESGPALRFY
jgi:hypothetical protein